MWQRQSVLEFQSMTGCWLNLTISLRQRGTVNVPRLSALHVHLDAHHCLEVVVLKGRAKNIKRLAEELIGTKDFKHGLLMTTTTGKGLI